MIKHGKNAYEGTHWTQQPENKARLKKMLIRNQKLRSLARKGIKQAKKSQPKKEPLKSTRLIVNGWRVTLSKNEIRIENE